MFVNESLQSKLIVQTGPEPGKEYVLSAQRNVLGRDAHVDVQIVAEGISREHAVIFFAEAKLYIEDLNSSNGTYLNGERVSQPAVLSDRDRITLGKRLSLTFHAAVESRQVGSAPEGEAPQALPTVLEDNRPVGNLDKGAPQKKAALAPTLAYQVGQDAAQLYSLTAVETTLGRSEDNDIVVNLPIVSRRHAKFILSEAGCELQVLSKSTNPLTVNGESISGSHQLTNGDLIRIGRSGGGDGLQMRYQAIEESAVPASAQPPATMVDVAPELDEVGPGGTLRLDKNAVPELAIKPRLLVTVAGNPVESYELDKAETTIGRAASNDIVIPSPIVSRHHATLVNKFPGFEIVPASGSSNPLLHQGRSIEGALQLRHEDILRVGSTDPGVMVTLSYLSPAEVAFEAQTIDLKEATAISIGRASENDVVLDSPVVSHFHAQIERVGQRFRVRDLRSSNGTFVNDGLIEKEVWLKADDEVRIGNHRFTLGDDQLEQLDESSGLLVKAHGLQKWVRKDLNILQDISLNFQPREFIVVVGQSGGGKSTLVDAIAGYRPATHGQVTVNGIDVYKNFDAIRNEIGYVPQKDIIHMELSVYQALDYTARLRMPPETTAAERHQRIMEVLEDLDLTHRQDVSISGLSGGQQKRVSIGVELLTKPGLFFLDEPTSGLDPGTETSLMQLMRRLADQGRTIVLITHATKNVMLADKVVFLARGGYLCWFGPPDEALDYFDQYRTDRERRAGDIEFDEIYAILDDAERGSPQEWAERYRQHPAHDQYGDDDSSEKAAPEVSVEIPARNRRRVGALRQFAILSVRNLRILTKDRFSLILMLVAAPLVSLLDVVLATTLGRDPFNFVTGIFPTVMITLYLPTVYGVMVGGISQMREIVKEQEIYKRERLVNLKVLPYIGSKVWVAAILAFYQAAAYVIVHFLAFDMPGGMIEFVLIYVSLALATMAGMMLGLFASALSPTPNAAPLIVILLMLPQIVLSGALLPLPPTLTTPISTRWAFEAFMAIAGVGADVAADACWQLPEEERRLMTLEYKNENCRCMGVNVVKEDSCDFPGVGKFYSEAIDSPPPVEPEPLRAEPARPEVPPQPVEPEDQADQVAMAEYFEALEVWQGEAQAIQSAYEQEILEFRTEAELFQSEMIAYQTELATWQIGRASAIEPAEGLIGQFQDRFGWTFQSREDPTSYYLAIARTWLAQGVIIVVLFLAIVLLQRRKDVI